MSNTLENLLERLVEWLSLIGMRLEDVIDQMMFSWGDLYTKNAERDCW